MKIFAISDIHVDYSVNASWVSSLSTKDYTDDVLILAGDISDSLPRLESCLTHLCRCFKKVLFVPGNHELWVTRDPSKTPPAASSLEKFKSVCVLAEACGASIRPFHCGTVTVIPLLGWYDYSFGPLSAELSEAWMDFRACIWPDGWTAQSITEYFCGLNEEFLTVTNETVISFSHFLPRIDVMPAYIPAHKRWIYPILGTQTLEAQIRRLGSSIHVYGHSHVNQRINIDGVLYINNAFAYPDEQKIASKKLLCIYGETALTPAQFPAN